MNREQAENVLDAYVENAKSKSVNGKKAAESLREVILTAMTETRYYPVYTQLQKPTWAWSDGIKVSELMGGDAR